MMLPQAEEQFKWREMFFGVSGRHPVLGEYATKNFVPFDWAPMTFVYRKGDFTVPTKLDDLLKPEFKNKFAIQDPRSSSPGLQFYNWIRAVKGEGAADWLAKSKRMCRVSRAIGLLPTDCSKKSRPRLSSHM